MQKLFLVIIVLAGLALIFGCVIPNPVCGNGICEKGENSQNCSISSGGDCLQDVSSSICGDNNCLRGIEDNNALTTYCPSDCNISGIDRNASAVEITSSQVEPPTRPPDYNPVQIEPKYMVGQDIIFIEQTTACNDNGYSVGSNTHFTDCTGYAVEPRKTAQILNSNPILGDDDADYWYIDLTTETGAHLGGRWAKEETFGKTINSLDINQSLCFVKLAINETKHKFSTRNFAKYKSNTKTGNNVGVRVTPSLDAQQVSGVTIGMYAQVSGESVLAGADGQRWWPIKVFNTNGSITGNGWAIEEELEKVEQTKNSFTKFNVLDSVQTITDVNVHSLPSSTAPILQNGRIQLGSIGTVAENGGCVPVNDTAVDTTLTGYVAYNPSRCTAQKSFVFANGVWWWKVNFNKINGANGNVTGWVDENYIEESENLQFSIDSTENLYGDYSDEITQAYDGENYPYLIKAYDSGNNLLGVQPLYSSRIMFYDNFDPANPGGIIELDKGTLNVYLKSQNINKVKMDYFGKEAVLNLKPENVQCRRTCGKENEIVGLNGACCDGLMRVHKGGSLWICAPLD